MLLLSSLGKAERGYFGGLSLRVFCVAALAGWLWLVQRGVLGSFECCSADLRRAVRALACPRTIRVFRSWQLS